MCCRYQLRNGRTTCDNLLSLTLLWQDQEVLLGSYRIFSYFVRIPTCVVRNDVKKEWLKWITVLSRYCLVHRIINFGAAAWHWLNLYMNATNEKQNRKLWCCFENQTMASERLLPRLKKTIWISSSLDLIYPLRYGVGWLHYFIT